jgi:hypothetical protein
LQALTLDELHAITAHTRLNLTADDNSPPKAADLNIKNGDVLGEIDPAAPTWHPQHASSVVEVDDGGRTDFHVNKTFGSRIRKLMNPGSKQGRKGSSNPARTGLATILASSSTKLTPLDRYKMLAVSPESMKSEQGSSNK